MELGDFAYTKVDSFQILLNSYFSSMLWYSGRSIRTCLFLLSVPFLNYHISMWDAVSWSLEHTLQFISSTFSCNFSFLYILVLINCCLMNVATDRTISGTFLIIIIIITFFLVLFCLFSNWSTGFKPWALGWSSSMLTVSGILSVLLLLLLLLLSSSSSSFL